MSVRWGFGLKHRGAPRSGHLPRGEWRCGSGACEGGGKERGSARREGGHEKEIIRKKWSSERAERSVRGSIRDGKTEDGRGLVKQQ